jgi:hypothetical protein
MFARRCLKSHLSDTEGIVQYLDYACTVVEATKKNAAHMRLGQFDVNKRLMSHITDSDLDEHVKNELLADGFTAIVHFQDLYNSLDHLNKHLAQEFVLYTEKRDALERDLFDYDEEHSPTEGGGDEHHDKGNDPKRSLDLPASLVRIKSVDELVVEMQQDPKTMNTSYPTEYHYDPEMYQSLRIKELQDAGEDKEDAEREEGGEDDGSEHEDDKAAEDKTAEDKADDDKAAEGDVPVKPIVDDVSQAPKRNAAPVENKTSLQAAVEKGDEGHFAVSDAEDSDLGDDAEEEEDSDDQDQSEGSDEDMDARVKTVKNKLMPTRKRVLEDSDSEEEPETEVKKTGVTEVSDDEDDDSDDDEEIVSKTVTRNGMQQRRVVIDTSKNTETLIPTCDTLVERRAYPKSPLKMKQDAAALKVKHDAETFKKLNAPKKK